MSEREMGLSGVLADELARHEVLGGGLYCECQPLGEDEAREVLPVFYDEHLSEHLAQVAANWLREQVEFFAEYDGDELWVRVAHVTAMLGGNGAQEPQNGDLSAAEVETGHGDPLPFPSGSEGCEHQWVRQLDDEWRQCVSCGAREKR